METKSSKVLFIVAVVALVVALVAVALGGIALATGGCERDRDIEINGPGMMRRLGERGQENIVPGPGRMMGLGAGIDLQTAAQALGMTEADLQNELQGGKTLAQVAQEKGVATQTLVDALLAEPKADLAQQVTGGKITQAQADQILADLTDRIQTLINSGQPGRSGGWSGPPCITGTAQQAT